MLELETINAAYEILISQRAYYIKTRYIECASICEENKIDIIRARYNTIYDQLKSNSPRIHPISLIIYTRWAQTIYTHTPRDRVRTRCIIQVARDFTALHAFSTFPPTTCMAPPVIYTRKHVQTHCRRESERFRCCRNEILLAKFQQQQQRRNWLLSRCCCCCCIERKTGKLHNANTRRTDGMRRSEKQRHDTSRNSSQIEWSMPFCYFSRSCLYDFLAFSYYQLFFSALLFCRAARPRILLYINFITNMIITNFLKNLLIVTVSVLQLSFSKK